MNDMSPVPAGSCASSPEAFSRAPVGLLAELTHRCPLQCPYCSNPTELERVNVELSTEEWQSVMRQAGELGVLQVHLSGGEPTVRRDLEDIVETAADSGLYTNLITAGVTLKQKRLEKLRDLGLDHVLLSVPVVDPVNADRISNFKNGLEKKRQVAEWTRDLDMPLTVNAPL
ncbi:MAG: radical SAM protein, partial [Pseudomonadota bacterium]